MATRTVSKEELICDRLLCMRKQGIRKVGVEITLIDEVGKPIVEPLTEGKLTPEPKCLFEGDLCPYHYRQLVEKVGETFNRTDEADPIDKLFDTENTQPHPAPDTLQP